MTAIGQCCYSNITEEIGGRISPKWTTLAVSPNLSSAALTRCSGIQKLGSTMNELFLDEEGNVLNLYEIEGDSENMYVLRTQYGLKDYRGRYNMFSHGYIFPLSDGKTVEDPNTFLAFSDENFRYTPEEAQARMQQEPLYEESFRLKQVVDSLQLSLEAYRTLLYSVAYQLTERAIGQPLYLLYDGTPEQMKMLLYLIYVGLPYQYRRQLKVASCQTPNTRGKNIIFSRHPQQQKYFCDPFTGQNSILNPRTTQRIQKDGYIDGYLRSLNKRNWRAYYRNLEEQAEKLGGTGHITPVVYRIASQLEENPDLSGLEDGVLLARFNDLLRLPYKTEYTCAYINEVLLELLRRKTEIPNEEIMARFLSLLETQTGAGIPAGIPYLRFILSGKSVEESVRILSGYSPGLIGLLRPSLMETETGRKILDSYYALTLFSEPAGSWNDLEEKSQVLQSFPVMPVESTAKLEEAAWNLYVQQLREKKPVREVFPSYCSLLWNALEDREYRENVQAAKEKYWDLLSVSDFRLEDADIYEQMAADHPRQRFFQEFIQLLESAQRDSFENSLLSLLDFTQRQTVHLSSGSKEFLCGYYLDTMDASAYRTPLRPSQKKWIQLLFAEQNPETLPHLASIAGYLSNRQYPELKNYLLKHREFRPSRQISSLMLQELQKAEKQQGMPVDLDLWLLSCPRSNRNRFEILEEYEVEQLNDWDSVVIFELLNDPDIRQEAENYASQKGICSRRVKALLKEQRKAEKRQASQGSFFSRSRDFLGLSGNDGEEEEWQDPGMEEEVPPPVPEKKTGRKQKKEGFRPGAFWKK